jgi:hypothetical protein
MGINLQVGLDSVLIITVAEAKGNSGPTLELQDVCIFRAQMDRDNFS